MTLKLVQLPLHLEPDQALTLIDFLEHLQTLLWNHYGDAIQRDLQAPPDIPTRASDFDDPVPFCSNHPDASFTLASAFPAFFQHHTLPPAPTRWPPSTRRDAAAFDTRSARRAMPIRLNRPPVRHRNGKRRWTCSDRSTNSSAKRAAGIRRATQTRKGNQWYFGMKAHMGVDTESGLVHTVTTTPANESDIGQAHALLDGEEKVAPTVMPATRA